MLPLEEIVYSYLGDNVECIAIPFSPLRPKQAYFKKKLNLCKVTACSILPNGDLLAVYFNAHDTGISFNTMGTHIAYEDAVNVIQVFDRKKNQWEILYTDRASSFAKNAHEITRVELLPNNGKIVCSSTENSVIEVFDPKAWLFGHEKTLCISGVSYHS